MKHFWTFLALLWAACDPGTRPTAGDLRLRLTTPHADDRAAQVSIQCLEPPVSVRVEPGYVGYVDLRGSTIRMIVLRQGGQFIPSQAEVARISVPDVNRACTASLSSVTFQGYGVRASLAGYSISVLKP